MTIRAEKIAQTGPATMTNPMENDPMNTFGKRALETLIAVNANEKRVRDDMAATLGLQREQGVPVWDFGPIPTTDAPADGER
jgi:hypothetical protein